MLRSELQTNKLLHHYNCSSSCDSWAHGLFKLVQLNMYWGYFSDGWLIKDLHMWDSLCHVMVRSDQQLLLLSGCRDGGAMIHWQWFMWMLEKHLYLIAFILKLLSNSVNQVIGGFEDIWLRDIFNVWVAKRLPVLECVRLLQIQMTLIYENISSSAKISHP